MKSRDLQLQSERALATAEATLSLLKDHLAASEARRLSEQDRFEGRIQDQIDAFAAQFAQLFSRLDDSVLAAQTDILSALKSQAEVLAIPQRDIPTVEELLLQAKSDPVIRSTVEATLAELEFADPQIEFN